MNTRLASSFVAAALATVPLAAPAAAAPTGPRTADQVVSELQLQGFDVIISKVGTAPLRSCNISAARPGQTHTEMYVRTDPDAPGSAHFNAPTKRTTVYVDLAC